MMADSFYVTLPSNSSMNLPTPLVFEGDWEVGLAEFSYPHSWFNITDSKNMYGCSAGEEPRNVHEHHIPPGYYQTPVEMLNIIKPSVYHDGVISMKYNKYNQKIVVKTKPGAMVVLYKPLRNLFGFSVDESVITDIQKGSQVVDIHFHSMVLYTNIIEHHVMGDTRAPLLRILNVEGMHGETISKSYKNPHYIPLKQKLVDMIEIAITDDTGQSIPFVSGRVIATLHFRKRRSSYFN